MHADADSSRWRRLRRALGSVRAQSAYLSLLRGPSPVGYIGWAGRENVGDDAMLLAHRRLLADMRLAPLPNLGPTATFRLVSRLRGGRPLGSACLGGGTLIGNGHFRTTLETVLSQQPGVERFMLGTGVESEEFAVGNRRDIKAELRRWVPLLEGFHPIRVRGPLSAATLEDQGVRATVVGDPALLLGDEHPSAATRAGLLGLNVGTADDRWGDAGSVLDAMARVGRIHLKRGGTVRIVAASSADVALTVELAGRVGPRAEAVVDALNPGTFLSALRECEVVVAEKLHATVLAAAVHVPAVALEYRPKCRDFQESIGRGSYVVRTDDVDVDRLVGLVDEIISTRDAQVADLAEAVGALRRRLRTAGSEIVRAWLATLDA